MIFTYSLKYSEGISLKGIISASTFSPHSEDTSTRVKSDVICTVVVLLTDDTFLQLVAVHLPLVFLHPIFAMIVMIISLFGYLTLRKEKYKIISLRVVSKNSFSC